MDIFKKAFPKKAFDSDNDGETVAFVVRAFTY